MSDTSKYVTLTPLPRLVKLRGTEAKVQTVKLVDDPKRCSHITAMCSQCRHQWERMFTVEDAPTDV